jgi:hypothetical protein
MKEMNLNMKYLCSCFEGILSCCKILRYWADGFSSPPKESVVRIFIALKNPSHSAGIEPLKLLSSGKHPSHYTTEDD